MCEWMNECMYESIFLSISIYISIYLSISAPNLQPNCFVHTVYLHFTVTEGCVPRAHTKDCNKFIECDRKEPIERQCESPNTYYSNTYKVCVWEFQLTVEEKDECGLKSQ